MKKVALTYYNLCLWFVLNQDSKKFTTGQFSKVLQKIGGVEDKLRELGMSEKRIQNLIDRVAKAYLAFLRGSTILPKLEVEPKLN